MALETLSPVVHLAKFVQSSPPGKLGNVFGPGGGFKFSPLGGGQTDQLVDMAGAPVLDDLLALATVAAQATTNDVANAVGDPGSAIGGGGADAGGGDGGGSGDSGDSGDGDGDGGGDGGAGAGSTD